jgi:hypothetical protein
LLRKLTLTACLLVALGGAAGQTAQASMNRSLYQQAQRAVCFYFKKNCATAMKIVKCETGGSYTPWSANGQYLGIFQMGSYERRTFGHGGNVWAQAKAAYAYFKVAGFGPWLNYEPPGCGD